MDLKAFVTLVSTTRLEVLFAALALTSILGIVNALKAGAFKWSAIAGYLKPDLNFFYMILGYVGTAAVGAFVMPDTVDSVAVVAVYTTVVLAMAVKIKEQLATLGVPLTGWKLPFEAQT